MWNANENYSKCSNKKNCYIYGNLRTPFFICHPVTEGLSSKPSVLGYLVFEGFAHRSTVRWSLKRPQWECKQCHTGGSGLGVRLKGQVPHLHLVPRLHGWGRVQSGTHSRSHWRSPCVEAELLSVWPRPRSWHDWGFFFFRLILHYNSTVVCLCSEVTALPSVVVYLCSVVVHLRSVRAALITPSITAGLQIYYQILWEHWSKTVVWSKPDLLKAISLSPSLSLLLSFCIREKERAN